MSELHNDQGIEMDMIDALLNNAALNHRLMPFRLFKKAVSKAAADESTGGVASGLR